MASIYKRKEPDRKSPFIVRYKDPITNLWKSEAWSTAVEAEESHQKWTLIETYRKNNNPAWKSLYQKADVIVTIQDVFDAFDENVLEAKLNQLTVNKYHNVMDSALV